MGRESIGAAEVRRIAALARLALSEPEVARLSHELGSILDYVARLDALELPGDEPAAAAPGALRDDEPAPSLDSETALGSAPPACAGTSSCRA